MIVRDKTRSAFYASVIAGTIGIFGMFDSESVSLTQAHFVLGGAGYILAKELLFPGGAYSLIDDTVRRLEGNEEVRRLVGPADKFAVYGVGDGVHSIRRRPMVQKRIGDDGRTIVDAVFYIEGSTSKAKVTVEAAEREDGGWEDKYLAVDVPGMPTKILVQPVIRLRQNSWNPFNRFF